MYSIKHTMPVNSFRFFTKDDLVVTIQSLINMGVPGQNGDRSAVLQPKLGNRWRTVFYSFGNPGETAPYDLTRAMRAISRPKYTFSQSTLYSYVSTVYIATRVEFDAITLRLFDDIDNTVSRRVQQQISKQQNFFDQTASRAGQNYKFEMELDLLAGGAFAGASVDPNVIEKWEYDGCFIVDATFGEMSYEDPKPLEISLTVRFDNCTAFDQNGQRMGTFSHSPEIDGRIGDFSTGVGGTI